jgi:hypothetical protein
MPLDATHDTIPGFALGGAIVRRPFDSGGNRTSAGAVLSAEDFLKIGYAVRRIFVREGRVTPFYQPIDTLPPAEGTRHIIHRGAGRYDVVHGTVLNADFLSREEAEALAATQPAA